MKKTFFVLAAAIVSNQLTAQKDTTVLDEVVITATKFEQKQSQTGKVVTVITKEQLEKSAGKSLAQLLNEQAGLVIAGAYNVPGSVQTIFIRGASSGRTLILTDGIPVNDPSMIHNEFDLNLFSIHDVERIEIWRGALLPAKNNGVTNSRISEILIIVSTVCVLALRCSPSIFTP